MLLNQFLIQFDSLIKESQAISDKHMHLSKNSGASTVKHYILAAS